LEKRIKAFMKKKPYTASADVDANGFTTHALQFTRNIPDSWSDSAAEAIEALRSVLDQCGYAAAVAGGVADPKNAYFPFADNVTDLNANVKGRCKDLPVQIRTSFVRSSLIREEIMLSGHSISFVTPTSTGFSHPFSFSPTTSCSGQAL
jgi:hypothetical protein